MAAYASTLNATESARMAGYRSPETQGSRVLARPRVRAAILRRLEAAQRAAGLPSDKELLERLHRVAWADPNELSSQVVSCCRHCHGAGHAFQWRDEIEWAEAVEKAIAQHEAKLRAWRKRPGRDGDEPEPTLDLPSNAGGYEFDHHLLPVDDCPKCRGEGVTRTVIKDTRFLSEPARWLYAGVKQTKDGIEVKMHDQLKMRELELRHRGLLNDKLIHITPGGAGALGVEQKHLAKLSMEAIDGFMNAHQELLAIQAAEARTVDVEAREVPDDAA